MRKVRKERARFRCAKCGVRPEEEYYVIPRKTWYLPPGWWTFSYGLLEYRVYVSAHSGTLNVKSYCSRCVGHVFEARRGSREAADAAGLCECGTRRVGRLAGVGYVCPTAECEKARRALWDMEIL